MGVLGLTSHMKRSKAAETVEFRPANRTRNPNIIIFDALGTLRHFMGLDIGIFCDFQQLFDKVSGYADAFWQCGFELVAVFDGSIDENKLPEWIQRKKSYIYDDVVAVNELCGSGEGPVPYNRELARKTMSVTISSGFYLAQVEFRADFQLYDLQTSKHLARYRFTTEIVT
eukprot:1002906_1